MSQVPTTAAIRVLLADDSEQLRDLCATTLLRDGRFRVVGAVGDGRDVVVAAAKMRPDVVLLDLAMPGLDGLQVLPPLRSVLPGSCIVVFSGFHREEFADRVVEAGADAYLEKRDLACLPERLVSLWRGGE